MRAGVDGIERSFQTGIVRRANYTAGRRNRHRTDSDRHARVRINSLKRGLCLELCGSAGRVSLRQREGNQANSDK
jgi:hypothetical protein